MKKLEQNFGVLRVGLLASLVFLLAGCQLAHSDWAWAREESDSFIGFFITMGHEGHSAVSAVADPATGRLYAERTGMHSFEFPGVEGIPFFIAALPGGDWVEGPVLGEGLVTVGEAGPGIVSDGMHVHVTDEGVSHTISGRLYVTPQFARQLFNFHPMYMTADFEVYISSGGSSVVRHQESDWEFEGGFHSFSKAVSRTTTENGVSQTASTDISLGIYTMFPPEEIVIVQMDADNGVLRREVLSPGAIPEEFSPLPGTAYIIVETHRAAHLENPVIRGLYGPGDDFFTIFELMDSGVLARQFVQLLWYTS